MTTPFHQAAREVEFVVNRQERALLFPAPEVNVDRLPRGKVTRQALPNAAFAEGTEDGVENCPQGVGAGTT